MNTPTTNGRSPYLSPEIILLDMTHSGVLCTSSEDSWFNLKGQGDFDYEVEDDDDWR